MYITSKLKNLHVYIFKNMKTLLKNDFPTKKSNFLWKDEYIIDIEKKILQFYGDTKINDLPELLNNNDNDLKKNILIKNIIYCEQKKRFYDMVKEKDMKKIIDNDKKKEEDNVIEHWWIYFEKNIKLQKIIMQWFFNDMQKNIHDNGEQDKKKICGANFIKNFKKYYHIHDKKIRLYFIWLLYFQKLFDLEDIILQKKIATKNFKQEKYDQRYYYQDYYLPYPIPKKILRTIIELPLKTENEITIEEFIQTWNRCYKRYNNIEHWNIEKNNNINPFHDKLGWIVYKMLQQWEKQSFCIRYFTEQRYSTKILKNNMEEIKKLWWENFERWNHQPWGFQKKQISLFYNYESFWIFYKKKIDSLSESLYPLKFKTNIQNN